MDRNDTARVAAVDTGAVSNLRPLTVAVAGYIAAVAGAEAIVVFRGVLAGLLCHGILIQVLLGHYIAIGGPSGQDHDDPGASPRFADALPVLAILPLLRILSVTMPFRGVPEIYWYVMVGTPLLLAIAVAERLLTFSWVGLGCRLGAWPQQLLIALSGPPLGLAGFLILRPKPLITKYDWREVAVGCVILIVFTGFTEEVLFRGMLQQAMGGIFGRAGVLWASALFAIMYIGTLSLGYVLFIGLVGLFFGWCVSRTGSIWGVVLAHGLLNIGAVIVCPLVLR